MIPFSKIITVTNDDLDDLNHVNNVRYVQWIQDISKEHWMHKAPVAMQEDVVWVVLNHNITYKSAAKLHDVIVINTYIRGARGATTVRVVEMFLENTQQLLVRSETQWCLLHAETLKPLRISEEIKAVFREATLPS
ncbi:thioesterase [Arenibacter sp. GZD96]|uniref:acyl-CoA thioesterase n=1 Tax=Aurantibrevibacter litoralis TaxID=3106030 RepID=UPI002AFEFA51|nr:acyl-ACP thioesterase domain-containing protein [Arenibacter sp. GZD-96]MEA1787364.1 thioesterase [Arenibacter sp. GZD-96]